MSEKIENSLSVQTVDGKGNPPKRRIQTAGAALSSYERARILEGRRDARFAAIDGIYAGFPPMKPADLEADGHGDMPNVNTKQFQAAVDAHCDTWNAVNAQGHDRTEVRMKHPDPAEAQRRSLYATKCFNSAISKWDMTEFANGSQFLFEAAVRDKQMGLYGVGIAFFNDPIDWRWTARATRKFIFPEGVRLCLDNCPVLFVEDQMSVTELFDMRNKAGWNEDAVLTALYLQLNIGANQTGRVMTWAEWTNRIRNNDYSFPDEFAPFKFVHVYCQEFDKTISHMIVSDSLTTLMKMKPDDRARRMKEQQIPDGSITAFLYDKPNEVKHWRQVITLFASNAGPEGTYHGVKGYGDLMYDLFDFGNNMFNRTAWAAIMNNTPWFDSGTESDAQRLKQIKITFGGIMAPGLSLTQNPIKVDVGSALEVFDLSTRVANQNGKTFPMGDQPTSGEAKTATQTKLDYMSESQVTNLQVQWYRFGQDANFAEMYRRIAQPASKYPTEWPGGDVAKEFRDQMMEHGIPEEDFLKVEFVRANRNGGSGSTAIDLEKARQALAVATPGQGQLNARKQIIGALYGPEMIPVFIEEEQPDPTYEDVQIDNENLFIMAGKTPKAWGFQDHPKHITGHFAIMGMLQQLIGQMQEQGIGPENVQDAIAVHSKLDAGIEHVGQHIAFMEQMPRMDKRPSMFEGVIKESKKTLNVFMQLSQALTTDIQSAMKQQQANDPNAGLTPEMLKARGEIQIEGEKAKAEIARKDAAAAAKIQNLNQTHATRTAHKVAENDLNVGLAAQRSVAEMEMEKARTQQAAMDDAQRTALELQAAQHHHEQDLTHARETHENDTTRSSE